MDGLQIKMNDSYRAERSYVCNVVFREFLGISFTMEFTKEQRAFYEISYNKQATRFPDSFFSCPPGEWLRVTSLPELPLKRVTIENSLFKNYIPVIYGTRTGKDFIRINDIDVLGSIFFMLTRYEEVNSTHTDEFGRFDHRASLLYKEDLLRRPIVNEYLEVFKQELQRIAPSIVFKEHRYTLSVSHDVDVPMTFHYSMADLLKKAAGDIYFRRSPQLLLKRVAGKLAYLSTGSLQQDPNNTFEFLTRAEQQVGIRSIFNFIPVQGQRPIDSHYSIKHPFILHLLQYLSQRGFEIGLHPSFDSFGNLEQTREEMNILNACLDKIGINPVRKGRQHYLRWKNPITWQIWNEIGMAEDSSVGYGTINGFRAGCAYKYSVFDLINKRHLNLVEEPLIVMDVNSNVDSEPETILEEVRHFAHACRAFGGNFTLLYHNNYVLSKRQKNVYSEVLEIAK